MRAHFPLPTIQRLTGGRLHLSHGPIDVVLKAWSGEPGRVDHCYAAAIQRFDTVLDELVVELALLRLPMSDDAEVSGAVALRMVDACRPFSGVFLTPMAAVAGSVADELMQTMRAAAPIDRAYVNDGGDIAVYVAPGQSLSVGVAGDFSLGQIPTLNGELKITHGLGIGGIATSGRRGRSFSLGIADSVTVLAGSAASADAAATLIANAVSVESAAVRRQSARSLDPDSDLGDRLVTVDVGWLAPGEIEAAIAAGIAVAEVYRARGLIRGAALMLRGVSRTVGLPMNAIEEPVR